MSTLIEWLHYFFLKCEIKRNGIYAPVLITTTGIILDGKHRAKIARELGIKVPVLVIRGEIEYVDADTLRPTAPAP